MSYDHKTTDTLGRDVEVTCGPFLTKKTTIDGGGDRTTTISLFNW